MPLSQYDVYTYFLSSYWKKKIVYKEQILYVRRKDLSLLLPLTKLMVILKNYWFMYFYRSIVRIKTFFPFLLMTEYLRFEEVYIL